MSATLADPGIAVEHAMAPAMREHIEATMIDGSRISGAHVADALHIWNDSDSYIHLTEDWYVPYGDAVVEAVAMGTGADTGLVRSIVPMAVLGLVAYNQAAEPPVPRDVIRLAERATLWALGYDYRDALTA